MDKPRFRASVALALAVTLAVVGFGLGEAGGPAWAPTPILLGLIGCIVVGVLVMGRLFKKVSIGLGMLGIYGVTFILGLSSFSYAFGECVERGEQVRAVLNEYRRNQGAYPETLGQLGASLPCNRISGRTILSYQRTANGYNLHFGDWVTEHTATESQSFLAQK